MGGARLALDKRYPGPSFQTIYRVITAMQPLHRVRSYSCYFVKVVFFRPYSNERHLGLSPLLSSWYLPCSSLQGVKHVSQESKMANRGYDVIVDVDEEVCRPNCPIFY